MSILAPVLTVKKKGISEENLAKDVLFRLTEIKNEASSIELYAKDIENIDRLELTRDKSYPGYIAWVEKEFAIEAKIYALAAKVLAFLKELMTVEEQLEYEEERNRYILDKKVRHEYNKKLWKIIGQLNWLEHGLASELDTAKKMLPEEAHLAKLFPNLLGALKKKYTILEQEIESLIVVVRDLNTIKNYLGGQIKVL